MFDFPTTTRGVDLRFKMDEGTASYTTISWETKWVKSVHRTLHTSQKSNIEVLLSLKHKTNRLQTKSRKENR